MKKALLITLVVGSLVSARSTDAQWAVYDAANHTENILQKIESVQQTINMIQRYEIMLKNLEKMDIRTWRDLRTFMETLNEVAAYGDAVAYSLPDALGVFVEHFPSNLEVTPEMILGGEGMDVLQRFWFSVLRDTYAGALGAAAEQGADYEALNEAIAELQGSADAADGLSRNLHVMNMLSGLQAQELMKMNQLLATLVNLQTVRDAHEVTLRSSAAETLDALVYTDGWEIPIDYEEYDEWDPNP